MFVNCNFPEKSTINLKEPTYKFLRKISTILRFGLPVSLGVLQLIIKLRAKSKFHLSI